MFVSIPCNPLISIQFIVLCFKKNPVTFISFIFQRRTLATGHFLSMLSPIPFLVIYYSFFLFFWNLLSLTKNHYFHGLYPLFSPASSRLYYKDI